jgi:hypothetical protein
MSSEKLQPREIQLHTLTNYTIKHICSSTIKLSIHHPTSILTTSNDIHRYTASNISQPLLLPGLLQLMIKCSSY